MIGIYDILFLPFSVLLIGLDVLTNILTFGWIGIVKKYAFPQPERVRSVPVNGDETHRIHHLTNPEDPFRIPGTTTIDTLYELAMHGFKTYANNNCMGTREFLGYYKGNPKVKHYNGDNVHWRTYQQVHDESHKFGAALCAAGLHASPSTTSLDKIETPCRMAIFENSCPEWMIACLGAFTQSMSVVTIYATLGMDSVTHVIEDNRINVILCNKRSVTSLVENHKDHPSLKTIVYTNDLIGPDDHVDLPTTLPRNLTVISFDEFVNSGDIQAYPPVPPKPDTTAVVMYTSGSTGKPKGVVITHAAVVAAARSAKCFLTMNGQDSIREGEEVHIAYLPLAHILELMIEFFALWMGAEIGYADHKCLSPTGAYPSSALQCFRPTFLCGVPKVWDTMKKTAEGKIKSRTKLGQYLVPLCLKYRKFALEHGFDTPFINKLVFSRFQANVGGRLRYGVSGGGPLNPQVEEFINTGFTLSAFLQGYGLTETSAALTAQELDDRRCGLTGPPVPGMEVKLESCPDITDKAGQPYLKTDRLDVEGEPIWGRGEVICRGAPMSKGYYSMPKLTSEVFEKDGWFHTGDIGQWTKDGSLKIVDRKKNLVKLKGGEYVALEKMEMTYGNSTFVDAVHGGICCYGDGDMDRPVALLQLREAAAMEWAKKNGIQGDFETILNLPEMNAAVLEDMEKEFANSDLSHLEKIVGVALLSSPWTPEGGCLTAANKLNRNTILREFEGVFNELKPKGIRR